MFINFDIYFVLLRKYQIKSKFFMVNIKLKLRIDMIFRYSIRNNTDTRQVFTYIGDAKNPQNAQETQIQAS